MAAANGSYFLVNGTYHFSYFNDVTAVGSVRAESVILMTLNALSMLTNAFLVLLILSHKKLRSPTNVFVLNLSSIIVATATVDILAAMSFGKPTWTFGSLGCKMALFSILVAGFVMLWTLAAISFDRYRYVVKPHAYQISAKIAVLANAVIWILGMALTSTTPAYAQTLNVDSSGTPITICTKDSNSVSSTATLFVAAFGAILPLAIQAVCYKKVMDSLKRRMSWENRAQQMGVRQLPSDQAFAVANFTKRAAKPSGDSAARSVGPSAMAVSKARRTQQVIRNLIVLVVVLVLLWTPCIAVTIGIQVDKQLNLFLMRAQHNMIALCIETFSAFAFPIFYCATDTAISRILQSWPKKFRRRG